MIDKFKKGGQLLQLEQLFNILDQNPQQAVLELIQKGVKPEQIMQFTQIGVQQKKIKPESALTIQNTLKQLLESHKHGAKLNYLKSLKNKCAEDEELVYFKKGGSIDCGCKKKEIGGPIKKDNSLDARNKFIAKYRSKKEQARIDSLSEADYFNPNKKTEESSDRRTAEQKMSDSLKKKIIKKSCGGSAVAKFKAKCGSKLKKHQLGGSLNGIPFMQKGSSFKEAWNNARKNKVRYFNYNGRMYNSKAAGIDTEYESFVDNINEASAQLPTNKSPKHLGWEENNPLSNELRGKDREIYQQGTESTIPGIIVTGNFRTKKTPTRSSVKSEVYYNMPLGRIEYIGRDGLRYWMAQSDANGQWYYDKIENSTNYGPKYHKAVPEGYIIPGTSTPITKNSKIGKIGLGLKKKWMKNGGSLNEIPFYLKGTNKGGINLNPPNNGVFNELKRNIKNGLEQGKKMFSSIPLNILLGGVGAGTTSVNLANKGKLFANWLVKDPYNSGLDQISALGWIGSGPAVGVAMFDPFRWSKDAKREDELEKYGTSSEGDYIRRQEAFKRSWNLAK